MKLFTSFFIVILTLIIFLSSIGKTLLLVDFVINRDYIANKLCEKKELKGNCCKGYCQLTKQLKQEENREPSKTVLEQKVEFITSGDLCIERIFFFFYIQKIKNSQKFFCKMDLLRKNSSLLRCFVQIQTTLILNEKSKK